MIERNLESINTKRSLIERAYAKAVENAAQDSVNLKDFIDLYGEAVVRRDEEYVTEIERRFDEEDLPEMDYFNELTTVFEEIFREQAELNEWLGPDVVIIKTSRFDDIKNGVDSVAEFRTSDTSASYLALAVDVTTASAVGQNLRELEEK